MKATHTQSGSGKVTNALKCFARGRVYVKQKVKPDTKISDVKEREHSEDPKDPVYM